uniref:BHLH domain-containing protein n=1 Tax=Rhodnius prolixus TaxID=13249 RepID=T1HIE6_RHOPR
MSGITGSKVIVNSGTLRLRYIDIEEDTSWEISKTNLFDATKSTKGASKLRRDLINAEIANLRDLLPLPPSTRQRLSQLQLMALVCVYVRKANYFQQVERQFELNRRLGERVSEVSNKIVFSTNVWCGVLGNQLIGPYFYRENLTGARSSNTIKICNKKYNVPFEKQKLDAVSRDTGV